MFASNLIRVGGLAAVLAGALLLIVDLWQLLLELIAGGSESFSEFVVTTSWTVLSTMYLLSSLLCSWWRWSGFTPASRRPLEP